jgi:hypothetical protein
MIQLRCSASCLTKHSSSSSRSKTDKPEPLRSNHETGILLLLLLLLLAVLVVLDVVDKVRRATVNVVDAAVPVGRRSSMRIIPMVVMMLVVEEG